MNHCCKSGDCNSVSAAQIRRPIFVVYPWERAGGGGGGGGGGGRKRITCNNLLENCR